MNGFESKLRALAFKQGFTETVGAVRDWCDTIESCSHELQTSPKMGRVLALVLNLGNALNSARGPAHGFALSSLPKLLDTRSFDGTTTLLHYLVAHLENKDEDLLQFTQELPSSNAPRGSPSPRSRRSSRPSTAASRPSPPRLARRRSASNSPTPGGGNGKRRRRPRWPRRRRTLLPWC